MKDKIYWAVQVWLFTLCGLAAYGFALAAGMMMFLAILQLLCGGLLAFMIGRGEIKKLPWPYVNVSPKLNLFLDFLLCTLLFLGGYWFTGVMWLLSCLVAGSCYENPEDKDPPRRPRRVIQTGNIAGGDIIGGDKITV